MDDLTLQHWTDELVAAGRLTPDEAELLRYEERLTEAFAALHEVDGMRITFFP